MYIMMFEQSQMFNTGSQEPIQLFRNHSRIFFIFRNGGENNRNEISPEIFSLKIGFETVIFTSYKQ